MKADLCEWLVLHFGFLVTVSGRKQHVQFNWRKPSSGLCRSVPTLTLSAPGLDLAKPPLVGCGEREMEEGEEGEGRG